MSRAASLPRRIARRLGVGLFARRLRRTLNRARSLEDLVHAVSTCSLGPLHVRPMQVHAEILELLEILADDPPQSVLEIGTARGGTLCLLARVAGQNATLVSVDLPAGPFGGGYPSWKAPLYHSFASPGQRLELLRGDSTLPETRARVLRVLEGIPLDFLLIDGDHDYEGVRRDFESYAPLVRSGGLVGFHDIRPGPSDRVGGVPRFWNEIRGLHRHREILAPGDHQGFGLGVLWIEGLS